MLFFDDLVLVRNTHCKNQKYRGLWNRFFVCLKKKHHVYSWRTVTFKSKHWPAMLVCLGLSRLFFYFVFVFANLASALPCCVVVLMAEDLIVSNEMNRRPDRSRSRDGMPGVVPRRQPREPVATRRLRPVWQIITCFKLWLVNLIVFSCSCCCVYNTYNVM